MASIFRYAIKGGIRTTVREELQCIDDYARIMEIRYMGRASLTVDVDEALLPCAMVKMPLQPILENAFIHGLEGSVKPIQVTLKGCREGDHALFEVADDGVGMSAEKLEWFRRQFEGAANGAGDAEELRKNPSSIGLANIHGRIRLFYGPQYGLMVESRPGEGTTVTVRIPVDNPA